MRWRNVPIPETLLVPFLVGLVLHWAVRRILFERHPLLLGLASLMLLAGLLVIILVGRSVGNHNIEAPDALIITGPYATTCNPMCLGWMLLYLSGIRFSRSLWVLLSFPVALLVTTHYPAVIPEEKALKSRFGAAYSGYCQRIPRYS